MRRGAASLVHAKQLGMPLRDFDHFLPAQRERIAAEELILHVFGHGTELHWKAFCNAAITLSDRKSLALHNVLPAGHTRPFDEIALVNA